MTFPRHDIRHMCWSNSCSCHPYRTLAYQSRINALNGFRQALTGYVVAIQRLAERSTVCSQQPDYSPQITVLPVRVHTASYGVQIRSITCLEMTNQSHHRIGMSHSSRFLHMPQNSRTNLCYGRPIGPFPEGAVTSASRASRQPER